MEESLLQFIWQMRLYSAEGLRAESGERVRVLAPGTLNGHAGPDFADARVDIGGTLWAGSVEIHRRTSDWFRHRHHLDPAYNNVVLHVAAALDGQATTQSGAQVPQLRLAVPPAMADAYRRLLGQRRWVPCETQLPADSLTVDMWLERLSIERLERKTAQARQTLDAAGGDYNECLWRMLAQGFGFGVNGHPFAALAERLPMSALRKIGGEAQAVEAAVMGAAGLLPSTADAPDDYTRALARDYALLERRFGLRPLGAGEWKFGKTRPGNSPYTRLAQLAALAAHGAGLAADILRADTADALLDLLSRPVAPYWQTHSRPGEACKRRSARLGGESARVLAVNVAAPFLTLYGIGHADDRPRDKALAWLEALPPEKNGVVARWNALGVATPNARLAQAALELRSRYCQASRCLECPVGAWIVRGGGGQAPQNEAGNLFWEDTTPYPAGAGTKPEQAAQNPGNQEPN